jgi:cation transport regulator ChaB
MQSQENLGCPGPVHHERPARDFVRYEGVGLSTVHSLDPQHKPYCFEETLHNHTSSAPPEQAIAPKEMMQRHDKTTADNHREVAETQLPHVRRQQAPHSHSQRVTSILDIPQHSRNHHDKQRNPEQCEEAAKIVMVASGVKMRYARDIIDGIEQATPSSRLFPGAGYRMR